jgi:hypothetical protein
MADEDMVRKKRKQIIDSDDEDEGKIAAPVSSLSPTHRAAEVKIKAEEPSVKKKRVRSVADSISFHSLAFPHYIYDDNFSFLRAVDFFTAHVCLCV